MRGFFAGSVASKGAAPMPLTAQCGACGLHKTCQSPKMPYTGGGGRGILIVGEAPGKTEDEENEQFVGASGKLLRRTLSRYGVSLNDDCWKTNAIICRPPDNRTPTPQEIGYCRPNLVRTIKEVQPRCIIALGGPAIAATVGHYFSEGGHAAGRWAGWQIPLQPHNVWVCPTYHPAFILRGEENTREGENVSKRIWERHLAAALELDDRPWDVVPDYRKEITCIYDPTDAAKQIRKIIERGGPCSWDLETNALKPEARGAAIVSCGICWRGKRTIAYPWHGPAITATQEFLRSPLPKVGANIKFEERWCWYTFGHGCRNWVFDTVLGAHQADNRKYSTSVGFQAFVRLGLPPYYQHVSQYLEAEDDDEINDIVREVDLRDLLVYNGEDCLVEYRLAEVLCKELGLEVL